MTFRTFYSSLRARAVAFATLLAAAMLCCSATPQATAGKTDPTAGRTISFTSLDTASNVRIKLMREDGTGVVTINRSSNKDRLFNTRARWSPDGTMLGGYAKALRDDFGVMAMTADGSQEWVVVSAAQFNSFNLARPGILSSHLDTYIFPCWLGNGAMVFPADTGYDSSFFGTTSAVHGDRLFIADAEGNIWPLTEAPPLERTRWEDADPHWSPVLDAIVFVSDRNGFDELYAIRPDGTGLTQITDFQAPGTEYGHHTLGKPVWSPLGDRIAVAYFHLDTRGRDLLILDVDLTQPVPGTGAGRRVTGVDPFKLAQTWEYNDAPSWSPSGDRLVFHRYFDGWAQIVIADVTTGTETVIAESDHDDIHFPDWKPVP